MSCDVIEVFGGDTGDYKVTFRNRKARTVYDLTAFTAMNLEHYATETFTSSDTPGGTMAMTILVPATNGEATFSADDAPAAGTYGFRIVGTDGSSNTFTLRRGRLVIT